MFAAVITYNGIINGIYNCQQYSILSLLIVTAIDLFISLLNIYLGLNNQQVFHLYFTPALWFFIIFSILDFRLLQLIWRMQNRDAHMNMDPQRLRRATFFFNLKVYLFVFGFLILIKLYIMRKVSMIFFSLGLVPQIIQIARKQVNNRIDFYYTITFMNSRMLILVA